MASDHEAETGSILWKHTAKDGFPDLPDVGRVYFLYWPAPAQINVVEKLRTHLLGATPQKSVTDARGGRITVRATQHTDAVIDSIARASIPIVHIPNESEGFVNWSNEDTKILWTKVIEWWHNDKHALHLEQFSRGIAGGSRADEQLTGLFATAWSAGMFLRRAVLPAMQETNEENWKDILAFLQDTRRHEVYLTAAWPYVLIHRSSETQRVGRMIADDLSSDVKGAVGAGAHAVRHWIHLADAGLAERPPKQSVDALLHRVVFRRRIGAEECLRQLTLLLAEQPRFFGLCDVDLMVASLTPWSESIRLPVQDGQDGDFPENERPDLRVQLGGLAAALSEWIRNKFPGRPEPPPIADLRAQYASDPLPEVRRSFDVRS